MLFAWRITRIVILVPRKAPSFEIAHLSSHKTLSNCFRFPKRPLALHCGDHGGRKICHTSVRIFWEFSLWPGKYLLRNRIVGTRYERRIFWVVLSYLVVDARVASWPKTPLLKRCARGSTTDWQLCTGSIWEVSASCTVSRMINWGNCKWFFWLAKF